MDRLSEACRVEAELMRQDDSLDVRGEKEGGVKVSHEQWSRPQSCLLMRTGTAEEGQNFRRWA